MAQAPRTEATDENTVALDEIADRWARYVKAKQAEKIAKEVAEEAKREVTGYLRERGAEFGTIAGSLVARWRPIPKPRFQQKKFVESHPDLAAEFTVEADEWRLEQVQ